MSGLSWCWLAGGVLLLCWVLCDCGLGVCVGLCCGGLFWVLVTWV